MSKEEHQIQMAAVEWFRWNYSQYEGLLAAFNNSEYVANPAIRPFVGAKLKKLGVVAGMPDLGLFVPRMQEFEEVIEGQYQNKTIFKIKYIPALFLELKTTKGKLSPSQVSQHAKLRQIGYQVEVAYGYDETIAKIKEYLDYSIEASDWTMVVDDSHL